MIEQFYDLRPEVLALDRKALDLCRAQFAHVEEILCAIILNLNP